jgi:TniQ
VSIPPIPPRSRLYRLEPIGIGTPYVESLTSYVTRLAAIHHVTPKHLIMGEIVPPQSQHRPITEYQKSLNKLWHENTLALNGLSFSTAQWVDILQSLTTCDNLRFLTMLTFSGVIAVNRLVCGSKAWCPRCYEEWRLARQVIYEPLLWALKGVDVCHRHQQLLVSQCPHCQRTSPFLSQAARPGYCPHCTRWLGSAQGSPSSVSAPHEMQDTVWLYWAAEASGDLLAAAPNLAAPLLKEQVAMRVEAFVARLASGNRSKLARLWGISIPALWGYLFREQVPYFDSLLRICFASSITPLEFLTTSVLPPSRDSGFSLASIPTISKGKGKRMTEEDVQWMKQVLEEVLALDAQLDSFPSLRDVARQMGFDEDTVRNRFPDLSKAISRRYVKRWADADRLVLMKQKLEDALRAPEPGSLATVARQLGCEDAILRKYHPDLSRAIVTRYRERINYTVIEQRLREVLASDAEVPSIYELVRELGYPHHVVWGKFPELCKQVSARRSAERKRRRAQRMDVIGEEIRRTAFLLHERSIYPSAKQIGKVLKDPHITRTKEGREAWILALTELGYPTGKFGRGG